MGTGETMRRPAWLPHLRRGSRAKVDFRRKLGLWLVPDSSGTTVEPVGTHHEHPSPMEPAMTTFDEREKSFEKKFAMDQDLKFKAESRRNKALAQWAAAKLGFSGTAVDDYVKAVRKADLAEKGD